MDDVTGHTPTPLVLDCSVLQELARGEVDTIELVLRYDAHGQPLVLPALAITHAVLDLPTDEAVDLLHGIAKLQQAMVAPLRDTNQAARLATVMALTGLDVWDAHAAMVADASVCPILTYNAAKWDSPSDALENRLHTLEIRDPEDKP